MGVKLLTQLVILQAWFKLLAAQSPSNTVNEQFKVGLGVLTIMGCKCKDKWEYKGEIFEECANPNDDPNGNWCIVEPDSCPNVDSLLQFVNKSFGMPQEADHCVQSSLPTLPYSRNDFGLNMSTLQFSSPISSYTIVSTSNNSSSPPPPSPPPYSLNTALFNFKSPTPETVPTPTPKALPTPTPTPTPTPSPSPTAISQVNPDSLPEGIARAPTFDFLLSAAPDYLGDTETFFAFPAPNETVQQEEQQIEYLNPYTPNAIVQDVELYIDIDKLPQKALGCVDLNTVLNQTKEFSTFNDIIVETGYSKIVEGLQNQTVFISTNSAWNKFADVQSIDIGDFFLFQSNLKALKEIAQLHIIDEILDLEDMLDADQISVPSQLDNQNITISSDGSKVQLISPNSYSDPALVLDISPVEVCQGFYYIINNVLTPKIIL